MEPYPPRSGSGRPRRWFWNPPGLSWAAAMTLRAPAPGLELSGSVRHEEAKSILSRSSGFIANAGFTHSLTPARNCLYGCSYCYVPTLRIFGGLRREDWQRWGRFTTHKSNAADLLARQLRRDQVLYCSPLVDPYQSSERQVQMMPRLLAEMCRRPPRTLALQTRSPLVLRDVDLLQRLGERTRLRVSFSLPTDRDEVRRLYEPRCESIQERVQTMKSLSQAGIEVHCTLAPILPCNPENLAALALEATQSAVIADPLHTRALKPSGATTRPQALQVSRKNGFEQWHEPPFQKCVLDALRLHVEASGRMFGVGEDGFRMLTA